MMLSNLTKFQAPQNSPISNSGKEVSQSVIFCTASSIVGHRESGAAVYGREAGTHTGIHTPKGNLERPINLRAMFLDCGRKPEYLVRTHACTERTCKLYTERPSSGSRTQDLLAARPQYYQLCHHAAHLSNMLTKSSDSCDQSTRFWLNSQWTFVIPTYFLACPPATTYHLLASNGCCRDLMTSRHHSLLQLRRLFTSPTISDNW
ncbi:hypothetical protein ILYODFUR_018356 [Ilyodon furcidens]|uniref:Uncharacterized protein n=1 Tax=Ilyodon furcidens TaxID=33524 RepID=A0ABV0SZ68_9TELE